MQAVYCTDSTDSAGRPGSHGGGNVMTEVGPVSVGAYVTRFGTLTPASVAA